MQKSFVKSYHKTSETELIILGALVSDVSSQTHQYHFVSTSLNWTDGQRYADLVTIEHS